MKHPTQDRWLDFVYGEVTAPQRLDLEAHLAVCPDCTRQVKEWHATGTKLDAWRVSLPKAPRTKPAQWPWAAAAAMALLLGIATGRWSTDGTQLRGQVAAELRAEFDQKLNATTAQLQLARQQDNQVTLDLLQQVEARRLADRAELREQLETVAVYAESGLQRAQHQMRTFALRSTPDSRVTPVGLTQP